MFLRISVMALCAAAPLSSAMAAGPVTFTKDVLPILQENCQDCHRPDGANLGGMVAPMAFMSYQETRPWAKSMAKAVSEKAMPPWDASPAMHGLFANERVLTQEQIDTIVTWAKTGAKRGNPADAPEPRVFEDTGDWSIGKPDLVVSMPEPYFVKDDVEDIYVNFHDALTAAELPEDRWMKAIEFRPGSSVVHHIISNPLGGIAPGNDPTVYPEGYSVKLRKGTNVSFEMHYHKEAGPGTGAWDQSKAAIIFYPEGYQPEHEIRMSMLGNFRFQIPAGDPNYTEYAKDTFDRSVEILSFTPHMHLRGKSAQYVAQYPDGNKEMLLDVPEYDFNWQTTYWYKEPKILPPGSSVELAMAWDNSANNPYNPDPTRSVRFGEPTTDEMFFGFMYYAFEEEPQEVIVDERILSEYTGRYKLQGDLPMVVTFGIDKGKLTAAIMGQDPVPLTAETDTRFTLADFGLVVNFEMDAAGDDVEAVKIKLMGETHEALPLQ
jgi:mono/diheme cytochrome c family protein